MTCPVNYHTIIYEEYPDVHIIWCQAVDADFEAHELYEQGKIEEAKEIWKVHREKWAEYEFATKLIFEGPDELK